MPSRSRSQRTLYSGDLLGPLETEVMTAIWQLGTCTLQEVRTRLPHTAAYTTVITTLRRLVKKKLLQQKRRFNHILLYSPTCSEREWQQRAAKAAVERLLTTPNLPRELLISTFEQAVREGDAGQTAGEKGRIDASKPVP